MQIILDDQSNIVTNDLSYLDRDSLFGDGFFTTGVILENLFVHQEKHLKRIKLSAKKLLFNNLDFARLIEQLQIISNKTANAAIRITITRRQQQRGYAISPKAECICKISLFPCPALPSQYCELIDSMISVSSNPTLAGIKHLNRLDSVLSASQLTAPCQEALMYSGHHVICGSKTNLFVKLDGSWLTPKLDQCGVEGITRTRVIEAFSTNNVMFDIVRIKRTDLMNVDAAFLTNSLMGVWPVKSINGRILDVNAGKNIQKLVSR